MRNWVSLVCALAIVLTPVALYADATVGGQAGSIDWTTGKGRKDAILHMAVDDNYLFKAPGMLVRGISNTGFGWVELLTHPYRWSRNAPMGTGTLTGVLIGPFTGTTMAVLRTLSGALDIGTFWIPFWHGVPMGRPVLGIDYDSIEDKDAYYRSVKRYFFNGLSEEF